MVKYKYLHFDPTDYDSLYNTNRSEMELRQFLAFAIAVGGKRANQTANAMDRLLEFGPDPFANVSNYCNRMWLESIMGPEIDHMAKTIEFMASLGFGCQESRTKAFLKMNKNLMRQDIDLRTCTVEELESCLGIGPKTARFFLLYSRPGQELAALDVHIWKVVRDHFPDAPKNPPFGSKKKYQYWEAKFLSLLKTESKYSHLTPVEFDFYGWDGKRKGKI